MSKPKALFPEDLKVLLVDDNVVDRKLLEFVLSKAPSNISDIRTAKNLKTALKILEENHIDVIVLDLNLPDSSGVETLVKITELHPSVAVVVNTGVYEDDLGIMTMGMGAQDFIIKGKYRAYGLIKAIHYAKERKKVESELKAAHSRLQEAQSQLIHAEKMHVIGRLASGVAHEVKNPLATILFGIAFLSEKIKSKDEKVKLTLKSMAESSRRANEIIKDLLDFSSLSKLTKKPASINKIVEKVLSLTNHPCNKNCIKVSVDLDESLPDISCDENRIEQVLVNFVLNSVHAMASGGQLDIKTYKRVISEPIAEVDKKFAAGSSVVAVEVRDNGAGIPADKVEKVFDPFFTTRRAAGGVGLGLSVAKNIADMHDGVITLENHSDGGVVGRLVLKI